MDWRRWCVLACMLTLGGCTAYEYEEEVFLDVDGSGSLRVSGSSDILKTFYGGNGSSESMAARFRGPGFDIDSVRESVRDGRRFVHVQGRFAEWSELCAHPAFAERDCGLDVDDDELALHLALPAPRAERPASVPADARLALRFHFPSTVRYHNSPSGIERGNIIAWERTVGEHFGSADLVVDVAFERRSVLATTLVVLGTAVGIVLSSVALAIFLMVRKGRRELARESGNTHTATVQAK